MMGLIYKIANDINEKVYVGQTVRILEKRIAEHKRHSKNKKYKFPFYRAIRKYGWKHFRVEILEDNIPLENLNNREIFWAEKFNAISPFGYTLKVGEGRSQIYSEELKKKMRYVKSKEHIEKIRKILKKRNSSFNFKKKISGKNNHKARSILCYDLNDNFIKEYDCIRDASRELNLRSDKITLVCQRKRNYTGNYKFKYK